MPSSAGCRQILRRQSHFAIDSYHCAAITIFLSPAFASAFGISAALSPCFRQSFDSRFTPLMADVSAAMMAAAFRRSAAAGFRRH
jgi:hypothetical protein